MSAIRPQELATGKMRSRWCLNYVKGTLALAHNGNLINAHELREELEYTGAIFQTTIDTEVIAYHDRARAPEYADGRGGGKKCDDEVEGSVFPELSRVRVN